MIQIAQLKNVIQDYAWGSRSSMSEVLGKDAPDQPEAEMWMGAHPSAPSMVRMPGGKQPLHTLIADDPDGWLGAPVAKEFGRLPFLFKLLAADEPLSLQAHPTREQAIAGFARENEAGIALDARNRNYRDDNHKPEIICAVTEFWALRGFRQSEEIVDVLDHTESQALEPQASALRQQPGRDSLTALFAKMMELSDRDRETFVRSVVSYAKKKAETDSHWSWIERINSYYPDDIGVAGAAMLNIIRLDPGQAMYLPAGELHAYLNGVGMELMANSNNVLRGGLTPKHVDVPELLNTLSFSMGPVDILSPKKSAGSEAVYQTPLKEFQLSVIHLLPYTPFKVGDHHIEILFCLKGSAVVSSKSMNDPLVMTRGESIVVPASAGPYTLSGEATVYRATVPL